ncbi:MAG: di-trans,poly-cis-decaprenylcistransferase [Gemmatimonadetes bacterium]|nr:di-trans,poly-cis-decaprenylcistransferase [Gemmatimonadota bacterium]
MDGNGRWARERGQPRVFGHQQGMQAVKRSVEAAGELGVSVLSLYAFSQENWSRPRGEIDALMELLSRYIQSERRELVERGVRVRVMGQLERLTPVARAALSRLLRDTQDGHGLILNLAISYGGRWEILEACRRLARRAAAGELEPESIDEERFAAALGTAGLPDPDLLIRTSGEFRVSNFLLWQIAYTEIHVTEVLWPDFGAEDFFEAVYDFQRRERRFGKVPF